MKINIHKKALKFIAKQPKPQQQRIMTAIKNLPHGDIKVLKSHEPLKRLRVGTYRIIFDHHGNIIDVIEVGNRGDVYNNI